MDIMTGGKLWLIQTSNIELILGQFIHPLEGKGMELMGWIRGIVSLARCEFHFIIEHENLV